MCRAGAALVVVLSAAAQVAQAQAPGAGTVRARALLARAESLWTQLGQRDSANTQRIYRERRARRFDAGPLTVLLPGSVGLETGFRVATGAAGYLGEALPPEFVASRVVVAFTATGVDSVVRAEGLSARTRVMADVAAKPDSLADGWVAAAAVARDYRDALDTTWREWLPQDLAMAWTLRRDGAAAARDLMSGDTRAGADCLAGSVAGCRLWLGLDGDASPYLVRYGSDGLRRLVANRYFEATSARDLAHECTTGSDEACERLASLGFLPAIPAGLAPRSSVLAFIRARKGPAALPRAFADVQGSVGERLARSAGIPEDSLVGEWRIWLLTGGGQSRVTADLGDALPVVVFGGLLLLAAARGGRWR